MLTKHKNTKSQTKTKVSRVSKLNKKRVNLFKRMLAIFLYEYED